MKWAVHCLILVVLLILLALINLCMLPNWINSYSKPVYAVSDGSSWAEASTDAFPQEISNHAVVEFDDKMWVIGGYDVNWDLLSKVYYSTDGVTWTEAGTDALPEAIHCHAAVAYDSKIWTIGGTDLNGDNLRNVFYSVDNVTLTPTPTPTVISTSASSSFSSAPSCTAPVPLFAPDLFQIDTTKTKATLWYAPVPNPVTRYFIAYGIHQDHLQYGIEYNQGYSSGVLSYTINELAPNTTYYFKIRAGNGCMPGPWDNYLKAKTTNSELSIRKHYRYCLFPLLCGLY